MKTTTFKTRNKRNAENWERIFRYNGLAPKVTFIVNGNDVLYLLKVPNSKSKN